MKKLLGSLLLSTGMWMDCHNAAVNAMTEWGGITKTNSYSPMAELWFTSVLGMLMIWAGIAILLPKPEMVKGTSMPNTLPERQDDLREPASPIDGLSLVGLVISAFLGVVLWSILALAGIGVYHLVKR